MLQVVLLYILRQVVDEDGGEHGGEREDGRAVPHRRLAVERTLRVHQYDCHLYTIFIYILIYETKTVYAFLRKLCEQRSMKFKY